MVKDGLITRFGIERSLRHAQLSRAAGRRIRHPSRPDDGVGRSHRDRRSKAKAAMRRGRILSIDTILVGAQIINQLQSIVARNVDPLEAAVVSICMFQAGHTDNVIPQHAQAARHRAQPDRRGPRTPAQADRRGRRGHRAALRRQGQDHLRERLSGAGQPRPRRPILPPRRAARSPARTRSIPTCRR